jgi:hypothetical protein
MHRLFSLLVFLLGKSIGAMKNTFWYTFGVTLLAGLLSACAVDDRPPNDCLIVAYRAQAELPAGAWSRLLRVRYPGETMDHVYLVFALPNGQLVAWDAVFGARTLRPRPRRPDSRLAMDVVRVADPRAIRGWYVGVKKEVP